MAGDESVRGGTDAIDVAGDWVPGAPPAAGAKFYPRTKLDGGGDGVSLPILGSVPGATQPAQPGLWINGQYMISPDGGATWRPAPGDALGQYVQGPLDHDAPVGTSRPVRIAGKANNAIPGLVAAGDVADIWVGLSGQVLATPLSGTVLGDGASTNPQSLINPGSTGSTMPVVPFVYNGTNFDRQRSVSGIADGGVGVGLSSVGGYLYSGSGATWDKQRGNEPNAVDLASAPRTASTFFPNFTNFNARGILFRLDVTAASGTGGLQVVLAQVLSGIYVWINPFPVAIIATGVYGYMIYPGASAAGQAGATKIQQYTPAAIPRSCGGAVLHGDGSSYTYSLSHELIV